MTHCASCTDAQCFGCQTCARLRALLARRTAALRLYGVHHSMCLVNATRSNRYIYWHDGDEATCDCGISAALAALPDAPKGKP